MTSASIFEAKTNLSKYIKALEEDEEPVVIITRNGKPVARLVRYYEELTTKVGLGKGIIPEMDNIEDFNNIPIETDFMRDGALL